MTVRTRLLLVTALGLTLTMALWGWLHLRALAEILQHRQLETLYEVAQTAGEYFQHFPTRQGLVALDRALEDLIEQNPNLVRIDVCVRLPQGIGNVVGVSRVSYDWPEADLEAVFRSGRPRQLSIQTEAGPALALLYPVRSERSRKPSAVVAVAVLTHAMTEVLSHSRRLLLVSSVGLLLATLAVLTLSYRWIIGRPLRTIIETVDALRSDGVLRRIPLQRRDEWGRLARHFNQMTEELERVLASHRALQQDLERRVQAATHHVIQLQYRVNQLERLAALGQLVAVLAHDLGTPLHSIAGLTQLLLEQDVWPPEARRKLELILQQTQRLHAVIQNVRRATRLPEPRTERVPVSTLLDETLPFVEPWLQRAGVRLQVDVAPDLPPLYADRYRVQTVLLNLIQNAVEAMPSGGRLTISARMVPERHAVAIAVRDTGPGIPPEVQARMFEPFFSTRQDEGLRGLGLAIVQDIVRGHGGSIEVESRPGEGTCFVIYWPVAVSESEASADPAGSRP
ncbi:Sensor protein ZraS [bacterium HR11]|nr:Sensor protein ZraS [bacterium HR11]